MTPRSVPVFLYGTAWKKARTANLVHVALRAGFRGIDTARQPKHYNEELVADGIRAAFADGTCKRSDLFIQTKFTPIGGQDPANMPYDPSMSIREQVTTSIRGSLANFTFSDTEAPYLDCVVLHSPFAQFEDTLEAWTALSAFVERGDVHRLGISNVGFDQLQMLCEQAGNVRPSVVQNRFYPQTHWARDVRAFCRQQGIIFQSFWTLTANPKLLHGDMVASLAKSANVSHEVAMYALVIGLGAGHEDSGRVVMLNGTTNEQRMNADLEGLKLVEQWKESNGRRWTEVMDSFQQIVDGGNK